MKELLLLGYNKALELKALESIDSESKQDTNPVLKELVTLCKNELENKIQGVENALNHKATYAISLGTLVMPISLINNATTKNDKKEKNLVCNNDLWLRTIYNLDNPNYDEDSTEELDKLLKKQAKGLDKLTKDMVKDQISGLVVNRTRTKTTGVMKRTPISLLGSTKAYPFPYLWGYSIGIMKASKDKLLKITYQRLDGRERVHYLSSNRQIINSIYNDVELSELLFNLHSKALDTKLYNQDISSKLLLNVLHVPDLSLPRNSEFFTRKITISSILFIEDVTNDQDTLDYLRDLVNINLEEVTPSFIRYASEGFSEEDKNEITSIFNIDKDTPLEQAIIVKDTIETTRFRIALHKYMISRQDIFKNYTGEIVDYTDKDYSNAKVVDDFASIINNSDSMDDISL